MGGDPDLLTWFILGIGAFDLIGGWLMFQLARQSSTGEDPAAPSGPDTPGMTRS